MAGGPAFTFTERTPAEHGFARVFLDEIAPLLDRHEARRRETRRKALKGMGVSGLAGAGGAGGAYGVDFTDGLIIAPLLGGAGAFMVYTHYRKAWSESLSADVMPVVCRFLGGMRYGGTGFDIEPFARLGLLPSFTSSAIEDVVAGHHDGFDFALCEARLSRRTRSSRGKSRRKTVFKGLLIRIELLEDVPQIYFARKRGALGNWLSEKFSSLRDEEHRLETPYPEFEKIYETYTRDREAARDFLTPEFAQGMLRVAEEVTGRARYVAAATEGRHFYLALPRKGDFLSLGSLFRPLTLAEDDLHQCIADLDLPRRMIDTLRGM